VPVLGRDYPEQKFDQTMRPHGDMKNAGFRVTLGPTNFHSDAIHEERDEEYEEDEDENEDDFDISNQIAEHFGGDLPMRNP